MCATKRIGKTSAKGESSSLLDRLYGRSISEATSLLAKSTPGPTLVNSSAPDVEGAITKRFSYGKQLGAVSDALSELLKVQDAEIAKRPGIAAFREMQAAIEDIKFHNIEKPKWPQLLSTRVYGGAGLPDVEIFTVPNYVDRFKRSLKIARALEALDENPDSLIPAPEKEFAEIERDFSELHSAMLADPGLQVSSLQSDPAAVFGMLLCCLSLTDSSPTDDAQNAELIVEFARSLYEEYQIPVINSPLSGTTLATLASSVGPSTSYIISLASSASPERYLIGVALLGGTTIVLGASQGIADGLKASFGYWIRRILRVPQDEKNYRAPATGPQRALADSPTASTVKKRKSASTATKKSSAENKARGSDA